MPSFAESVAESFQSEVAVQWRLKSVAHAVATFEIKTLKVEVDFEQREPNGPWHVGFKTVHGDLQDRTNMAFRIFNGVFQSVEEFIATREPEAVVFIAKDEDLASIYETYFRRETPKIATLGYQLEGPHHVAPYIEWTLRRLKPSAWRDS